MNKQEAIQAINEAFDKLNAACEHRHEWDQYVNILERDERDYRKGHGGFGGHPTCGITVKEALRFWAVHFVFERFVGSAGRPEPYQPEAKDFFSVRQAVFASAGIADLCRVEIQRAFTPDEMGAFLAIDYAALMNAENKKGLDVAPPGRLGGQIPDPPTLAEHSEKLYACKECGFEKQIKTNHWGEVYSFGYYNTCPNCPPFKRPNTWTCKETPPAGFGLPARWQKQ